MKQRLGENTTPSQEKTINIVLESHASVENTAYQEIQAQVTN